MTIRLKTITGAALAIALGGIAVAQPAAAPPLADTRVQISTLVREDLFAGFLQNDMTLMARGEANLEQLLKDRPADRAGLLSWKSGAVMYHAVVAREAGKPGDYARLYAQATALQNEADALKSSDPTVLAVGGGIGVLFADRLAPADRPAEWARTYGYYQALTAAQAPIVDKLPPHIRGEGLAGLVMGAQRTGHTAEADAALDHMLTLVKDTPYEATAQRWKAEPASRATTNLGCKSCHDDGRLAPTMARLAAPPPAVKG